METVTLFPTQFSDTQVREKWNTYYPSPYFDLTAAGGVCVFIPYWNLVYKGWEEIERQPNLTQETLFCLI